MNYLDCYKAKAYRRAKELAARHTMVSIMNFANRRGYSEGESWHLAAWLKGYISMTDLRGYMLTGVDGLEWIDNILLGRIK